MAASVEKLRRAEQMAREMGERDALELKAALETEKQAAEKEKEVSEINVFTIDPNGFKTHWKVTSDTNPDDLKRLMNNQLALTAHLASKGYQPDEMNRGGGGGGSAPAASAPVAPACPDCGGPTEHKTGKKDNGGSWAGWFCIATAKAPKNLRHKPIWEDD